MLSILNKSTLQEEWQNFVTKMCFWTKREKSTATKQKKSNIKTHAGDGNRTRDLLLPKRMRYYCTTESTESIDCRQAI